MNNSAHDCAARLSDPRVGNHTKAFYGAWDRFSGRLDLTNVRAVGRLVSLVVGMANEVPLSVDDAQSVRDQSNSRSWN